MTNRLERATLVLVACLLVLGWATSCGVGEASTDELCDDACTNWSTCDDAGSGYNWSYDSCYSDCKSEGDWDESYVDCVLSERLCSAIEAC